MVDGSVTQGANGTTRLWLLIAGMPALVLGLIGLYMTFGLTIAGAMWYGVLMLVAGIMQIVQPFLASDASRRSAQAAILLGLVYAAAGLYALLNPLATSLVLTLVLGIALVASGLIRAGWAFFEQSRKSNAALVLAAVLSLVLGFFLIAQWPMSGLWTIGLLISCDLIAHGFALTWTALRTR